MDNLTQNTNQETPKLTAPTDWAAFDNLPKAARDRINYAVERPDLSKMVRPVHKS